MASLTLALIHFRTCEPVHFERAWYTVTQQTGLRLGLVEDLLVYDNNSGNDLAALQAITAEYGPRWIADPHGDPTRTHAYSVNRVIEAIETDWLCVTRSDYLLAPDALAQLWGAAQDLEAQGFRPFVSAWCYQSAYDRAQQDLPPVDLESYSWRTDGIGALVGAVPGFTFHETDKDAGVWLTRVQWLLEAGMMNEQLSAWGYSQSTFQRALAHRAGVLCYAVPHHLIFHQAHGIWSRDFDVARAQYTQFGGGM